MPSHLQSNELIFFVNGKKVTEKNADPEVNLLSYLRKNLRLTGTKYACGGGGCGACTVMVSKYDPISKKIRHSAVTACLLPICSLHGAAVTTVEGIGSTRTRIHPVQERIAKGHGTQCGFCTPGMVMSLYALLRNHPEPSPQQLTEALGGNLCRCTGYRSILESSKTFCAESNCCQMKGTGKCCLNQEENQTSSTHQKNDICTQLYTKEEFQPLDPTQELIFPPELLRMTEDLSKETLTFYGERITWISPVTLKELLELKAKYPKSPLVMGNTSVGPAMKFQGLFHPVLLSPARISELSIVTNTNDGLTIGAACSLDQVKQILTDEVSKFPEEKTRTYQALLKHLRSLAGQQIRNMASLGGHVISRHGYSDLNPILAAGNATLNLVSKEGRRQIPLNEHFLTGLANADLKPEEILESVHIPHSEKWEFVAAFRQAQCQQNALPDVNCGMRVLFKEHTDIIAGLSLFYGGLGSTTVSAHKSCQQLLGRNWNTLMLDEAYRLILDEISPPGSAPGGMVEFKRTLIVSFFFKFYLQVLQELKKIIKIIPLTNNHRYLDISEKFLSALEEFPVTVSRGVQEFQGVNPKQSPHDPVGRPILHQSGIKHATGEAIFCDDLPVVDKELFLALVTSTRAHAKILSIDASEALELPGVVEVITAEDIPGTNGSEDEKLLAVDEVLCVGHIICAVAAESDVYAKRAVEKVKIIYQDQEPVIFTIEDAIRHNSYLTSEKKLEQGNVEKAFEDVDQILEGEMHVGGQEHFYMETQRVLVIPKAEDKEMEIYVSTQDPSHVQKTVSSTLNIPINRITCHVKRVGGGFGGKVSKPAVYGAITAVAANKTGRPIRLVLDRREDMLIKGGRHPLFAKYKVGFMNNGRIKAMDVECYINGGCTLDDSELVIEYLLLKLENAYKINNLRFWGRACKTNLPSNTAFRGFGFPQGGLLMESCITAVAAKCCLPPEKIREKNMYKRVDKTIYKQAYSPDKLIRCWNECLDKSSYHIRRAKVENFNSKNYWKKKGIAIVPMKFSVGFGATSYHQAAALVHIYTDGSVLVTHGGSELGQGIHTKMLQIASRELKIPMSYMHFCETNTATVPNTIATAASIGADVNGKAVQNACQILLKRLEPIIKKNPDGTWENWVETAFEKRISLSATGYFRGYKANMDWEKGEGDPFPYYVEGAACSEVEIDCLTGAHKNIRTDIVMDASCSINPAIDIGQIEGSFIQGLGLYTMEELKYSPEGVLHSQGPDEYKIPTATDIPEEFNVSLLASSENPMAIYSSKGLGESGMFLGCSVFFAISDAVTAARKERGLMEDFVLNSPATPERIRMACVDKFTEMIPIDDAKTFKPWSIPVV
ncbi:aldehyde oxidase 2-like isoform X1 [Notamacropus eugenii]|uniref:aldehyde oxidase 2-like isoform X1 n=1 Tax=Notamacropus eugenii TaxID=9315 RepID=UPI003B670454